MLPERVLRPASRIAIVFLSLALFIFSLTRTGFVTPGWWKVGETIDHVGWDLLASGWVALPFFLAAGIPTVILFFSILCIVLALLIRSRGDIKILSMISASMIVWIAIVAWFDPKLLQAVGWGAWLANPGMMLAWGFFLFHHPNRTFAISLVSFVLMICFLFVQEGPFGPKLETNSIIELGQGYWIWVTSALVMVAASFPYRATMQLHRTIASANRSS